MNHITATAEAQASAIKCSRRYLETIEAISVATSPRRDELKPSAPTVPLSGSSDAGMLCISGNRVKHRSRREVSVKAKPTGKISLRTECGGLRIGEPHSERSRAAPA
jgi:hypothetical protein